MSWRGGLYFKPPATCSAILVQWPCRRANWQTNVSSSSEKGIKHALIFLSTLWTQQCLIAWLRGDFIMRGGRPYGGRGRGPLWACSSRIDRSLENNTECRELPNTCWPVIHIHKCQLTRKRSFYPSPSDKIKHQKLDIETTATCQHSELENEKNTTYVALHIIFAVPQVSSQQSRTGTIKHIIQWIIWPNGSLRHSWLHPRLHSWLRTIRIEARARLPGHSWSLLTERQTILQNSLFDWSETNSFPHQRNELNHD